MQRSVLLLVMGCYDINLIPDDSLYVRTIITMSAQTDIDL